METQVKLQFEKFDSFISEVSANVSLGGMFIRTEQPAPVGAMLNFELRLSDDFKLIQGRGEVVWVRPADEGPDKPAGMGIRFRELDTASRELIYKIVYHRMKAGQRPFDLTAAATGGGGPVKGIGGVPSGPAPASAPASPPPARPAAPAAAVPPRPSAAASSAPRPAAPAPPPSASPATHRPSSAPPPAGGSRPSPSAAPTAPRVAAPVAPVAAPASGVPAGPRTAANRQAGLPGANPRPSGAIEVVPPAPSALPAYGADDPVGAAPASRPPDGGRSMARQTVAPAIVPTPLPSLAATAPVSPPSEILSAVDDVLTTSPLAAQPALDAHAAPPLGEAEMSFRGLRMSEGELALPQGDVEQAGFELAPAESVPSEPLARLSRRTLSADTIVRQLSADEGERVTLLPSEPSAAELEETDSLAVAPVLAAAPSGLSPVWSPPPPAADELSFADLSESPRARSTWPPPPSAPVASAPASDPFAELARRTAPAGTQPPPVTTSAVDLAGAETVRLEAPRRPAPPLGEALGVPPAGAKAGQERITAAMILTALEAEERREPPAPRPAEPPIFGAAAERPRPAASGWAVALVSLAVLAGLGYVFRAQVMALLGLDQQVTLTAADRLRRDEASGLPILPDVSQHRPAAAGGTAPVTPGAELPPAGEVAPAPAATATAPAAAASDVGATTAAPADSGAPGAWPSNPEPAPAPPAGAERSRSRPTSLSEEPPPAATRPAAAPAIVEPPLPQPTAPTPAAPQPTAAAPAASATAARFTSIDSIRARADGARTVVTITANGDFVAKSWSRFRLDGGQPRELFKFYGLKRDFRDGKTPVGTPQLLQIRAANHPGGELHVVLDLASGANRVTAAEVNGNLLTLTVE